MRKTILTIFICSCVSLVVLFCPSQSLASLTVHSGWDLLVTLPSTQFQGQNYAGVPYSTFNFGGTIGTQNVGITDTIMYRTQNATVSSVGDTITVPIQLVGLQLRSENPFLPGDQYAYITLQTGISSTGSLSITFGPEGDPHGTFTSSFDVFFDVHYGSLDGPIIQSGDKVLSTSITTPPQELFWAHDPSSKVGVPLIAGVDYLLDGTDTLEDFWSINVDPISGQILPGIIIHDDGQGTIHAVTNPEPATICLLALGGLALLRRNRK